LSFCDDPAGRFGGGDCLALFLNEYVDCLSAPGYKAQPLEWIIEKVHAQDGLAVIAHHRSSHSRRPVGDGLWRWRNEFAIDGWEVFNGGCLFAGNPETASSYPEESISEGYISLSATDSHTPFQANCSCASCSYVFVEERTADGLKEALIDRRVVAFCNGFLCGRPEWVERFKAWRRDEPGQTQDLLCGDLVNSGLGEDEAVRFLERLVENYARAHLSTEEFQKELLALSDLTWRLEHSDRLGHALQKTLTRLSQRMFELDEQAMLNWYRRSYQEGLERVSVNPNNAEALYEAGQAGAFFPDAIGNIEEAREHLERALTVEPDLHAARAALINLLTKSHPDEALAHCEGGLTFRDASPYVAALQRHLLRLAHVRLTTSASSSVVAKQGRSPASQCRRPRA